MNNLWLNRFFSFYQCCCSPITSSLTELFSNLIVAKLARLIWILIRSWRKVFFLLSSNWSVCWVWFHLSFCCHYYFLSREYHFLATLKKILLLNFLEELLPIGTKKVACSFFLPYMTPHCMSIFTHFHFLFSLLHIWFNRICQCMIRPQMLLSYRQCFRISPNRFLQVRHMLQRCT